jgi:secreted trypsin-like serine protease
MVARMLQRIRMYAFFIIPTYSLQVPCGTLAKNAEKGSDYIIGGLSATAHKHPWIARIRGFGCTKKTCGGSLISRKHLLTAFHCTNNAKNAYKPCDHSDGSVQYLL